MEFTTRFGLHSQTTRLRGEPSAVLKTASRSASMGLTPAMGSRGHNQEDLGAGERPARDIDFLYTTVPEKLSPLGFGAGP